MQRFSQSDGDFEARVCALTAPMEALDPNLVNSVRDIIAEVRSRGDQALLEFTQRFDQHPAESVSELVFEGDALKASNLRLRVLSAPLLGKRQSVSDVIMRSRSRPTGRSLMNTAVTWGSEYVPCNEWVCTCPAVNKLSVLCANEYHTGQSGRCS